MTHRPVTVLLVGDDPDTRDATAMLFETVAYTVVSADSAERALSICRTSAPDAVITDVVAEMKEVRECILALRESCPSARVIAMSSGYTVVAGNAFDVVADARLVGADLVLRKPVLPEALLPAISALLAR